MQYEETDNQTSASLLLRRHSEAFHSTTTPSTTLAHSCFNKETIRTRNDWHLNRKTHKQFSRINICITITILLFQVVHKVRSNKSVLNQG